MAEQGPVDKWTKLKTWLVSRHDYFEKEYLANNLNADAAELGAYRAVYLVMRDLEEREAKLRQSQRPGTQQQQEARQATPKRP